MFEVSVWYVWAANREASNLTWAYTSEPAITGTFERRAVAEEFVLALAPRAEFSHARIREVARVQ